MLIVRVSPSNSNEILYPRERERLFWVRNERVLKTIQRTQPISKDPKRLAPANPKQAGTMVTRDTSDRFAVGHLIPTYIPVDTWDMYSPKRKDGGTPSFNLAVFADFSLNCFIPVY
jgi:hypothetical protein